MSDKYLTDPLYCAKEMKRMSKNRQGDYVRNLLVEGAKHIRAIQGRRDKAVEECAKVCDAYADRMRAAHAKPHPVTGRENTIALCKMDAGESLAQDIRALRKTP